MTWSETPGFSGGGLLSCEDFGAVSADVLPVCWLVSGAYPPLAGNREKVIQEIFLHPGLGFSLSVGLWEQISGCLVSI